MLKIAIIGAGQIGSRHLQALACLETPCQIELLDPSLDSLNIAKERFYQIEGSKIDKTLQLHQNMDALSKSLDVVFITTTSSIRRLLIEQLVASKSVQYLVLEKVLFQALDDYATVSKLLAEKQIKTFVNHPRRQYPTYKEIKSQIEVGEPIHMTASGGAWGMACNGLHFIDLFVSMTELGDIQMDFSCLDKEVIESKRNGFLEVNGSISGKDAKGNTFNITCYKDNGKNAPISVDFRTATAKYSIQENGAASGLRFSKVQNDWQIEEQKFELRYQSQLSNLVVNDLLNTSTCRLTTYEQASKVHQVFIKGLLVHMNQYSKAQYDKCPIT